MFLELAAAAVPYDNKYIWDTLAKVTMTFFFDFFGLFYLLMLGLQVLLLVCNFFFVCEWNTYTNIFLFRFSTQEPTSIRVLLLKFLSSSRPRKKVSIDASKKLAPTFVYLHSHIRRFLFTWHRPCVLIRSNSRRATLGIFLVARVGVWFPQLLPSICKVSKRLFPWIILVCFAAELVKCLGRMESCIAVPKQFWNDSKATDLIEAALLSWSAYAHKFGSYFGGFLFQIYQGGFTAVIDHVQHLAGENATSVLAMMFKYATHLGLTVPTSSSEFHGIQSALEFCWFHLCSFAKSRFSLSIRPFDDAAKYFTPQGTEFLQPICSSALK